ncbi:MAG TPA: phosphoribosylanthranilate isomerase [Bryobacteraceae bacterium]|jgi:phosphoribosylanthranilate isomerase
MIVKICGITNLEDALAAVDAGASAVGFNFYPKSPRYVRPEFAGAIAERVSGVLRVGVFVNETPDHVVRVMDVASMDVAQIYLGAIPSQIRSWRARNVDATFDASELDDPMPEAFLLDAPAPGVHGGTGHTFDWSRVPAVNRKIVLAGGLDALNVARAVAIAKPWGVDACSRLEIAPGRKDHKRMRDFIEAAMAVHV